MKTQRLEASVDRLSQVINYIEDGLKSYGCPDKQKAFIAMASEEIFVNIASYAYQGEPGMAEISYEEIKDPKGIRICFTDWGIPYNPLLRDSPDTSLPALERQAGGLGIFMVKQMMDKVTYEFRDGQNLLTMEKYWES